MHISVRSAASALGVDEDRVYRWIKQGELPAIREGEDLRLDRAELFEWATARGMKVAPSLLEGEAGSGGLLEALSVGGIFRDLAGRDAASALRSVVDHLPLPSDVDRDYLFEVLRAREDLGSTGVGEGIAIPHVRDPLVLGVPRPSVSLCFLREGVDFAALDGKPVDTLFAIICPTVRDHLHLLSRLGFALRDEGFRAALGERRSDAQILKALAAVEAGMRGAGIGR